MSKTFTLKANFSTTGGRHHKVAEFFSRMPNGIRTAIMKEMLLKYLELMEEGKVPRISFDDDFFSQPADDRNNNFNPRQPPEQAESTPKKNALNANIKEADQPGVDDITNKLLEAIDSDF